MTNVLKVSLAVLALGLVAASPAAAEQWRRPTVHGGELTREVTRDGRLYYGDTTRTGPNGGTYSSSATCFDGVVNRCKRSFTATGPEGKTVTGTGYRAGGPFGVRRAGSITGPNGNTVVGARRFWRR